MCVWTRASGLCSPGDVASGVTAEASAGAHPLRLEVLLQMSCWAGRSLRLAGGLELRRELGAAGRGASLPGKLPVGAAPWGWGAPERTADPACFQCNNAGGNLPGVYPCVCFCCLYFRLYWSVCLKKEAELLG